MSEYVSWYDFYQQKHKSTTFAQDVQKKKNDEVLQKLRSHTFVSTRESLISNSPDTEIQESEKIKALKKKLSEWEEKLKKSVPG